MTPSAVLMLLVLQLGFGQSSHQHLHEDHYIGQEHNPEHDMNILLGDEVCKQDYFFLNHSSSFKIGLLLSCFF